MRLRLSSSRQPYRRGGLKIGPKHAPTVVARDEVEPSGLLAILRDPVITIALGGIGEDGGEEWHAPKGWERAMAADELEVAIAAEALGEKQGVAELANELLDAKHPEDDGATAQAGSEVPAQPPVEPIADQVEPAAPKGAEPKAASGRQPRKASAKAGTKRD